MQRRHPSPGWREAGAPALPTLDAAPPGAWSPAPRPARGLSDPSTLVRILLALLVVETLYILSGAFSDELVCDDLRLSLQLVEKDYDRAQLVIKTLSLSCNTTEHENCLKTVDEAKSKYLNARVECMKRIETLTDQLDECRTDLADARDRARLALPHPIIGPRGPDAPWPPVHPGLDVSILAPAPPSSVAGLPDHGIISTATSGAVAPPPPPPPPPSPVGDLVASGFAPEDLESNDVAIAATPGPDPRPRFGSRSQEFDEFEEPTWLAIGIPTVPRRNGVEYLTETLAALVQHLPAVPTDPLFSKIKVIVMNNHPGGHDAFQRNRDFYQSSQWAGFFDFVDNVERQVATPPIAFRLAKDERRRAGEAGRRVPKPPDGRVQQQTRDVISVVRYTDSVYAPFYYLFMEDDFSICSNGIEAARYLINRATQFSNDWMAIRASFGLNGIFMHGEDLGAFATYLERHQARRPPDHLATEWFAGETVEAAQYRGNRTHIGFRFNIFRHNGVVSTLRRAGTSASLPGCWEPLGENTIFQVESFKESMCPSDDIWPCTWDTASCNPKYQVCFPNGTRPLGQAPQRIPWEVDPIATIFSPHAVVPDRPHLSDG